MKIVMITGGEEIKIWKSAWGVNIHERNKKPVSVEVVIGSGKVSRRYTPKFMALDDRVTINRL